jgi:hypothetical protein
MSDTTLGDAIVAAHNAVEEAKAERARLLRLALDRGASLRQVAGLLPVSFSTVRRWAAPGDGVNRSALDGPLEDER